MSRLKELQEELKSSIQDIQSFAGKPQELYDPINYIIGIGGKRIRPVLVLAGYKLFKTEFSVDAIKVAEAVEMFHNFTLLHDDILDDAPMRRGKATVHEKWDTPTAILSGDLLQIIVYQKLLELNNTAIVSMFNSMAIELCEGQMNDMLFETRATVDNSEYLDMIRQKTAVLLGFSLQTGAMLAGANEKEASDMYSLGINIGMGFQLMDDYLDSFGSNAKVGKRIGGDILEQKKTYLWNEMWNRLSAEKRDEVLAAYTTKDEEGIIAFVKGLMVETQADQACLDLAQDYAAKGRNFLNSLQTDGNAEYLAEVMELLAARSY
jgi:geranylgeranyl diphosphate synthase type II